VRDCGFDEGLLGRVERGAHGVGCVVMMSMRRR
jgi:hypothetical protein